jgi:hypothetical protein
MRKVYNVQRFHVSKLWKFRKLRVCIVFACTLDTEDFAREYPKLKLGTVR